MEAALAKVKWSSIRRSRRRGATDLASLHGVAPELRALAPTAIAIGADLRRHPRFARAAAAAGPRGDSLRRWLASRATDVLAKARHFGCRVRAGTSLSLGRCGVRSPVPLKHGQTYWIYLTNKSHPDGNYVWRMAKDAAGPRGHAWSQRYDYAKHTWVFRVYLSALER